MAPLALTARERLAELQLDRDGDGGVVLQKARHGVTGAAAWILKHLANNWVNLSWKFRKMGVPPNHQFL